MTQFETVDGTPVPAVTAAEMRAVDRVAVEEVGLGLLQMMENAGRGLAGEVRERAPEGPLVVLAGGGGNGGGGLCAARHLANRGRSVTTVLDREADALGDAAATQFRVLDPMAGVDHVRDPAAARRAIEDAALVVDALVGYSLGGAPRGRVATLVEAAESRAARVCSLDVPTGLDATTGERPGAAVRPEATVTLALPKPGLAGGGGDLVLADIAIPAVVFERAGVDYTSPFTDAYRRRLRRVGGSDGNGDGDSDAVDGTDVDGDGDGDAAGGVPGG